MVVHSGQASGGHYYSYIKHGDRWYKFDDGDVTEVNMEDDEELKTQLWTQAMGFDQKIKIMIVTNISKYLEEQTPQKLLDVDHS